MFKNQNCEINYCQVNELDNTIKTFIKENPENTTMIVTDLTPSLESLKLLKNYQKSHKINIKIIDHHESRKDAWKTYPTFFPLKFENLNSHVCATSLIKDLYKTKIGSKTTIRLIEAVRLYDTWDWKNQKDANPVRCQEAQRLNLLLETYGRDIFIKHLTESLSNNYLISSEDKIFCNTLKQRMDEYIKNHFKDVQYTELKIDNATIKAGIVLATNHQSELGNYILENSNVDIAIMFKNGKLSLRSRNHGVDVSKIAKSLNGGGHPAAAGAEIKIDPVKIIKQNI
jgi:oligoribonuclease NrnB/cAMP/cGMP phosphodiesterase (DHH superfamily)